MKKSMIKITNYQPSHHRTALSMLIHPHFPSQFSYHIYSIWIKDMLVWVQRFNLKRGIIFLDITHILHHEVKTKYSPNPLAKLCETYLLTRVKFKLIYQFKSWIKRKANVQYNIYFKTLMENVRRIQAVLFILVHLKPPYKEQL